MKRLTKRMYERLPCEVRRAIYRRLKSVDYKRLQQLRTSELDDYSLQPFDKYRCIFIHIPRTGGVSVAKSLFGNLAGAHNNILRYQAIFDAIEFRDYFKFAFVRNPWDRLVSAYAFLRNGGMNGADRAWAHKNLANYNDFGSFVRGWLNRRNVYTEAHFVPQFEFICIKGVPVVDYIGRFENLERDFDLIRRRLGIQAKLLRLNSSARRDYRSYYTEEHRDIVAAVYRKDIEFFGYDFEK